MDSFVAIKMIYSDRMQRVIVKSELEQKNPELKMGRKIFIIVVVTTAD